MKHLPFIMCAVLVFSCARETEQSSFTTLNVSSSSATRLSLNDELKSVWNKGDSFSIFTQSEVNEKWDYIGVDGASSGAISGPAGFYDGYPERLAIYPYDESNTLQAKVVTAAVSPSQPLLSAVSVEDNLHFSYLSSMVRVVLDETAKISKVTMKAYGSEKFGTRATIDFSQADRVAEPVEFADSIVVTPSSGKSFIVPFLPTTFTQGFVITIYFDDGTTQNVRYTEPITFEAGNLLDMQVISKYFSYNLCLTVDWTATTCPFPGFPTSTEVEKSRTDATYYLTQGGVNYPFFFHAGYFEYPAGHKQEGQKEYGYRLYTTKNVTPASKCIIIGRDSSFVRLPYIEGLHFRRFEAVMGNDSGAWRICKDSLGVYTVAASPGSAKPGDTVHTDAGYYDRDIDAPLYFFLSGGNALFLKWNIYYK